MDDRILLKNKIGIDLKKPKEEKRREERAMPNRSRRRS
jgi:hypothetical protein